MRYKKGLININKINREASRLSKFIKGELDYQSLCKYASLYGFNVAIVEPEDDIVRRFGLSKDIKKRKSFVYCSSARFIFIRRTDSPETYAPLLLHEIGHIVLGHADEAYMECHNSYILESEVTQFIEAVHHRCAIIKKIPQIITISIAAIVVLISSAIVSIIIREYQNDVNELKREIINNDGSFVYITPSGERYHRATCAYAEEGIMITKEEAAKLYTPCKICKP